MAIKEGSPATPTPTATQHRQWSHSHYLDCLQGTGPDTVATALTKGWVCHWHFIASLLLQQLVGTRQYSSTDPAIALLRVAPIRVHQRHLACHESPFSAFQLSLVQLAPLTPHKRPPSALSHFALSLCCGLATDPGTYRCSRLLASSNSASSSSSCRHIDGGTECGGHRALRSAILSSISLTFSSLTSCLP